MKKTPPSSSAVYSLVSKIVLKQQVGGETNFLDTYTLQNFCSMLKKNFSNEELTITPENTKKTLEYKTGLGLEEAYTCANLKSSEDRSSEIWKCALLMRKKILNNNINPLEEPVIVAGIMEGEVKIPDELKTFFQIMYTGSDSENDLTTQKERLEESSAADTVYVCSGGKQLTGKHLSLGVTVKAMTGSRRTVTLLNKFGHCASNETLRRIEMGMESTISETSSLVPSHIQKLSDLSTGLAWDNFDINTETPSDAETIYHTYGICYQNIDNNKNTENIMEHTCNAIGTKRKIKDFQKIYNRTGKNQSIPLLIFL